MTLSNPDACRCMGSWIYEQLSDDEISYLFFCSGVCTFCRGKCMAQLAHGHVLSLKPFSSSFHNNSPSLTFNVFQFYVRKIEKCFKEQNLNSCLTEEVA